MSLRRVVSFFHNFCKTKTDHLTTNNNQQPTTNKNQEQPTTKTNNKKKTNSKNTELDWFSCKRYFLKKQKIQKLWTLDPKDQENKRGKRGSCGPTSSPQLFLPGKNGRLREKVTEKWMQHKKGGANKIRIQVRSFRVGIVSKFTT